jgi:hypothetical protein
MNRRTFLSPSSQLFVAAGLAPSMFGETPRATDYKFWIGQSVSHFHPLGVFQYTFVPVRYFHGYNDPTAFHLPILWDNREHPLFKGVEKFRFADNHAFDFRGESDRTLPPKGRTLADSNQRAGKGFALLTPSVATLADS